jgi:predicted transposase/invertase (TIGR01784 family)
LIARGEEGIMSAERVLEKISRDKDEWARALARQREEMDYRSDLASAREKGIAIGEKRGERQGEKRGVRREKLEIARKMKADGLGLERIEKYSGLSRREIEGL